MQTVQDDTAYLTLCAAAGDVSRETFESLRRFQKHFLQWNTRINLVAGEDAAALWVRHIVDSAQVMRLAPVAERWLDLGSGGGFPGLVIAFFLKARQSGRIVLVESNRKKCAFLQATTGMFDLPASVYADRIEDVASFGVNAEVLTARALAPLPKLFELSLPWLSRGAKGLFHKGRDFRTEIESADSHWRFDLVEHASVVGDGSAILEVSDLRRL